VFRDPTVVNLNTGSFGPLPLPVWERVTDLRRQLAAGPTDFFVRRAPPLLWEARARLADFLGTDPRRLIFAANVSAAINLVAATLRLPAGGEILLSDHEYGAMHWCWVPAAPRGGCPAGRRRHPGGHLGPHSSPLPQSRHQPHRPRHSAGRGLRWLSAARGADGD
jgi:selenocysteine lyase/cysteine desulfurase